MDDNRMDEPVATAVATELGDRPSRTDRPSDAEAGLLREVRATDIEPYTGLRYLSKLFRFMAIILVVLLIAEVVTGLTAQGALAVPTLLGEASRLIVLAGVLWGVGDLALLLIDVGHDVRAARVLLARQTHHLVRGNSRPMEQSARLVSVNGADLPPPPPPPPIP